MKVTQKTENLCEVAHREGRRTLPGCYTALAAHSGPPHLRPSEPGIGKTYCVGGFERSDNLHEGKRDLHFRKYPHRMSVRSHVMHPLAQRNCNPIVLRRALFVNDVKCATNEQHGGHDAGEGRDAATRLRTSLASYPIEVLILKPSGSAFADCRRGSVRTYELRQRKWQCTIQTGRCAQRRASLLLQRGPKCRAAHVATPELPPRHAVVLPAFSHW